MKNYYVMNQNSELMKRDTLKECIKFCVVKTQQFHNCGIKPPTLRIFYDTGTEPVETFNETRNEQ